MNILLKFSFVKLNFNNDENNLNFKNLWFKKNASFIVGDFIVLYREEKEISINQLDITRWTKIPGARKLIFLGTLKNLVARKQQQANEFCRWRFTLKF